jgi:hypothetical protein
MRSICNLVRQGTQLRHYGVDGDLQVKHFAGLLRRREKTLRHLLREMKTRIVSAVNRGDERRNLRVHGVRVTQKRRSKKHMKTAQESVTLRVVDDKKSLRTEASKRGGKVRSEIRCAQRRESVLSTQS